MKPFDPTKPVQTRDGRKARIIDTKLQAAQPIAAAVLNTYGTEYVLTFREDGRFYEDLDSQSPDDLINIPTKRSITFWVNVYEDDSGKVQYTTHTDNAYLALQKAFDESQGYKTLAQFKVEREFEEGEGL